MTTLSSRFAIMTSLMALMFSTFAIAAADFSPYCPTPTNGSNMTRRSILDGNPLKGDQLKKHLNYKNQASNKNARLVFIGDSMVELFSKDVFASSFDAKHSTRFGISGNTVENLIWRLENQELKNVDPDAIVLMIGANNAGSNSNVEIGQGIAKVVDLLHQQKPRAKVLVVNVFPAGKAGNTGYRRQLRCINKEIAVLSQRDYVTMTNAGELFLDGLGNFRRDLTNDFVHPNQQGYKIFADAIKPLIQKMVPTKTAATH